MFFFAFLGVYKACIFLLCNLSYSKCKYRDKQLWIECMILHYKDTQRHSRNHYRLVPQLLRNRRDSVFILERKVNLNNIIMWLSATHIFVAL